MFIRCPLHNENTPSMKLYDDGWAHCFGCNAHVPISSIPGYETHTQAKDAAPKYVENIAETLEHINSLPVKPIRGLHFPADDRGFYIVYPDCEYYIRRFFEVDKGQPKYKAPSGMPRPLYKARVNAENPVLFVVEGELNAASAAAVLPEYSVVSPGSAGEFYSKTGLKFLPFYAMFKEVHIVADKDKPGAIAAIELKTRLSPLVPKTFIYLMDTDANEILETKGPDALRQTLLSLDMPIRVSSDQEPVSTPGVTTTKSIVGL